jgi:hypothetical protein
LSGKADKPSRLKESDNAPFEGEVNPNRNCVAGNGGCIQTQHCEDLGGGLNIGYAASGNYLLYDIQVKKSGHYSVSPRIASNAGALTQLSYTIEVDGAVVASYVHKGTGGWQNWESMKAKKVYLKEGGHKLRLHFNTSDINVNYLVFNRPR